MASRRLLQFFWQKNQKLTAKCRISWLCSSIFRNKKQTGIYESFLVVRQYSALAFIPAVGALGFGWKNKDEKSEAAKGGASETQLIEECDVLYDDNRLSELHARLLPYKDTDNDEILWRLARATYEVGKVEGGDAQKTHTYEAYELIQRALQVNDKNFAVHKWYAILLDVVGEYEGTKQRITNAYQVKEHLLKATDLNPTDATTMYSLGYWCFTVADLPWYQKKIASVIFATPPQSSYDEALKYFLEAEKVKPGFYSMNYLMVGKTYLRLKQKDQAKPYLLQSRDYTIKTEDDKKAHEEAVELLAGIGVK